MSSYCSNQTIRSFAERTRHLLTEGQALGGPKVERRNLFIGDNLCLDNRGREHRRQKDRPSPRRNSREPAFRKLHPLKCLRTRFLSSRYSVHRQTSIGGSAIDRLKESSSFENVDRLRDFRLDELPLARGRGWPIFGGLVIHYRLALVFILIYQEIPPGLNHTKSKVTGAGWSFKSQLRKCFNIHIDFESASLLETEQKLQVNACSVCQRRSQGNGARRQTAVKTASIGL